LHCLFTKHGIAKNINLRDRDQLFNYTWNYDRKTDKDVYTYHVKSFLDVGAGDGRVLDAVNGVSGDIKIAKKYGIELAKAQADDLRACF
jgi:hypothetical protein